MKQDSLSPKNKIPIQDIEMSSVEREIKTIRKNDESNSSLNKTLINSKEYEKPVHLPNKSHTIMPDKQLNAIENYIPDSDSFRLKCNNDDTKQKNKKNQSKSYSLSNNNSNNSSVSIDEEIETTKRREIRYATRHGSINTVNKNNLILSQIKNSKNFFNIYIIKKIDFPCKMKTFLN